MEEDDQGEQEEEEEEGLDESTLRLYAEAGMTIEELTEVEVYVRDRYDEEYWDEARAAYIQKFIDDRAADKAFIESQITAGNSMFEQAQQELNSIMGGENAHRKRGADELVDRQDNGSKKSSSKAPSLPDNFGFDGL